MRPFRDKEWEGPISLSHVFLTQDADWDPKVPDHEQSENPEWYSNVDDPSLLNPNFNIHGNYRHCIAYKGDHHDDDWAIFEGFNPTNRILVYEHDVYFDSSEELPLEFDIDTMTNCCVSYELTYTIMFIAMTLTDPSTSQCLTCQG